MALTCRCCGAEVGGKHSIYCPVIYGYDPFNGRVIEEDCDYDTEES